MIPLSLIYKYMNPNLILCTHHQFHPPFRLWREAFCSSPSDHLFLCSERVPIRSRRFQVSAASSANGAPPKSFYYDLIIIGAGVGGHGAALHAVEKGLKTAIIEGDAVGATCVNRGCVCLPKLTCVNLCGPHKMFSTDSYLKKEGEFMGSSYCFFMKR